MPSAQPVPSKQRTVLSRIHLPLIMALAMALLISSGTLATNSLVLYYPQPGVPFPAADVWVELRATGDEPIESFQAFVDHQPVTLTADESYSGLNYYSVLYGLEPGEHQLRVVTTNSQGTATEHSWTLVSVEPVDEALFQLMDDVDWRIPAAQQRFDAMLASGELWARWTAENKRLGAYYTPQLWLNDIAWRALAIDLPPGLLRTGHCSL